jgi:predicted dehydrogenase
MDNMMPKRVNRRQWLRGTALAGVGLWLGGGPAGAASRSPSEKLNLAFVGSGGRGRDNLEALAGHNVVALCDVDEKQAGPTFERYPKARRFHDFRKMLDALHRQLDAVVVSAPNHVHAPASVMAMRLGKHVYCEKPLAHSVYEARVAAEVAARQKVATQMGTQTHAGGNYRRAIELIRTGAIGPVREVDVWTMAAEGGGDRPKDRPPVPPTLQWDTWLGPAPDRPYHPCYLPRQWHFWWDFGGGVLGNVGCHFMDLPFWALELRHPTTVEAEGSPRHPETTPPKMVIRYEFPARGEMPPVRLTWYQGRRSPRVETDRVPAWETGFLFVGQKGMLLADYERKQLLPESQFAGFQAPKPTIPDSIGHHREWIAACKSGSPTTCNFDYSGALSETVLLGCAAYRSGKKFEWDAVQLKAKDCPEVDRFIKPEYRQGWILT